MVKSEKQRLHLIKLNSNQKGKNNRGWKGGRYKNQGYIYVWNSKHPHCTKRGYIREHILVMEKKIGRYLKPEEIVHHINEVRDDNRIGNLKLLKNLGKHNSLHHKGKIVLKGSRDKMSSTKKKLFAEGKLIPHNKGKTKENYGPLRIVSEKVKLKLKLRGNLKSVLF